MKNNFLFLLMFFSFGMYSQVEPGLDDLESIIKSEMKYQSRKIDFRANPLTDNYDLKYHRLEFEVDPAEHYIKGLLLLISLFSGMISKRFILIFLLNSRLILFYIMVP